MAFSSDFRGKGPSLEVGVKLATDKVNGVHTPHVAIAPGEASAAFGEMLVAEPTPRVNMQFPYNINSRVARTRINNGGTVTQASSMAVLQTSAAANASAELYSNRVLHYNPGQGAETRFTALFTTGAANSQQIIGVGGVGDGLFFGYNGATFGVLRRVGGSAHVETMEITAAATGTGNIVVTLDGNATNVAVSSGDTVQDVARKIAATDFSDNGTGWVARADGDTVDFISFDAAAHTGTYSTTGQGVTATFASAVTGAAPTDNWTAQTSWNHDVMDGTGSSGVTLDQTKGNVYRIQYQWLGFGLISFWIENPDTGGFIKVHDIHYANANTTPTVFNPTFPLCASVVNTSNSTNITLKTASMVGMVQGKETVHGERFGADSEISSVTTERPILTIRVKDFYQGKVNRTHAFPDLFSAGGENTGNKTIQFRIYYNATLTGPVVYTSVESNTSAMEFDVAATGITGGAKLLDVITVGGQASQVVQLPSDAGFHMAPGDRLTITAESSGTTTAVTSLGWIEEI